jgi:8-oxo-dGTP diphosphatase
MIQCTFENGDSVRLRHVVVDGIVVKDGKILLVKRTAKLLEAGKWALPGGFMEHGETTAQAIKREVMEETGWGIADVQLFRINDNPNRPGEDRQNVAFIYLCIGTEKTGEPDWESDEQKWFDLSTLPDNDQIAFDHATSIELYKNYLQASFPLPLVS